MTMLIVGSDTSRRQDSAAKHDKAPEAQLPLAVCLTVFLKPAAFECRRLSGRSRELLSDVKVCDLLVDNKGS